MMPLGIVRRLTLMSVDVIILMALAFAQNISFSIVSRARNRSSALYHLIAAILSNGVWYATFRVLVTNDMTWLLLIPYTIGTVSGSLTGSQISMYIERLIGAKADKA
jgi:hypothetical protein